MKRNAGGGQKADDLLREIVCGSGDAAIAQLPFIFHVVSVPDYTFVFTNQLQVDIADAPNIRKPEDATGMRPWDILPGWKGLQAVYEEVCTTGQIRQLRDFRCDTPLRTTFWDAWLLPVRDRDGRVASIAAFGIEVTDRKRMEDALRESEEQCRTLINSAKDAIFLTEITPDGTMRQFIDANESTCRNLGYSREQLLNMSPLDISSADDRDELISIVRRITSEGEATFEWIYVNSSGRHIPVEISSRVLALGGRLVLLCVARDISERKRADEERFKLAEQVHLLLESTDQGIYGLDADGNCMFINNAGAAMLGYSPDELLGRNLHDAIHARHTNGSPYAIDECPINKTLWTGRSIRTDREVYWRKDGTALPTEYSSYPIYEGDMVTGAVIAFTDITERKRNEIEILRARNAARSAAAHEAEARATIETILDTLPIGLLVSDAKTQAISYYSRGTCDILGSPIARAATDPEGPNYKLLMPDGSPYRPEDLPMMRSLRRGEHVTNAEIRVHRADGADIITLANSAPVRDARGRVTAAVASLIDVSELIKLRHALEHQVTLLQRALAPSAPETVENCDIATIYVPAFAGQEIGGDFYDVFRTCSDALAIIIGDASGKGIEAAGLASTTRSTVRAFAYESADAGDALTRANSVLFAQQNESDSFVTVFAAITDPKTGDTCYANAGHHPAAVCRASREVEILAIGNPSIGLLMGQVYVDHSLSLGPGDKLVLYTDGITDARHNSEIFDVDGVQRTLQQHGHKPAAEVAEELLHAAREWAHGCIHDDVAILVLARK